ncbi:hypothetical protein ONZ45_g14993 [Pleurotus djamor]|nr:hypothetical protein ONZ45_g14993 [Pleurotus djamor]
MDTKPHTASQHVFSIPELLSKILEANSTKDHLNCTRVCQSWSDIALGFLWRRAPLRVLYQLLAPTELGPDQFTLRFAHDIRPEAWLRLMKYAPYVREIFDDRSGKSTLGLSESVPFPPLATMPLLPNLRIFHLWIPDLNAVRLFASPAVKELTVCLSEDDQAGANHALLECISAQMPSIQKLTLSDNGYLYMDVEQAFPKLCCLLTELKSLEVPAFWLIEQCEEALPHLQALRELSLRCAHVKRREYYLESPKFSLRQLSLLQSIHVAIPYEHFPCFANESNDMSLITSLELIAAGNDCNTTSHLAAISRACPNLQSLRIPKPVSSTHSPNFTFHDFKPLLQLTQLRVLDIAVVSQINLQVEEIASLFQSLSQLIDVTLSAPDHPSFAFEHLDAIVPHSKRLERLALDLLPMPDLQSPRAIAERQKKALHFHNLKNFTVTTSNSARFIEYDAYETAFELAKMLPRKCAFHPGSHRYWRRVARLLLEEREY